MSQPNKIDPETLLFWALDAIDDYLVKQQPGSELELVTGLICHDLLAKLDPNHKIPEPPKTFLLNEILEMITEVLNEN
jgi:hypothetical protein